MADLFMMRCTKHGCMFAWETSEPGRPVNKECPRCGCMSVNVERISQDE